MIKRLEKTNSSIHRTSRNSMTHVRMCVGIVTYKVRRRHTSIFHQSQWFSTGNKGTPHAKSELRFSLEPKSQKLISLLIHVMSLIQLT